MGPDTFILVICHRAYTVFLRCRPWGAIFFFESLVFQLHRSRSISIVRSLSVTLSGLQSHFSVQFSYMCTHRQRIWLSDNKMGELYYTSSSNIVKRTLSSALLNENLPGMHVSHIFRIEITFVWSKYSPLGLAEQVVKTYMSKCKILTYINSSCIQENRKLI